MLSPVPLVHRLNAWVPTNAFALAGGFYKTCLLSVVLPRSSITKTKLGSSEVRGAYTLVTKQILMSNDKLMAMKIYKTLVRLSTSSEECCLRCHANQFYGPDKVALLEKHVAERRLRIHVYVYAFSQFLPARAEIFSVTLDLRVPKQFRSLYAPARPKTCHITLSRTTIVPEFLHRCVQQSSQSTYTYTYHNAPSHLHPRVPRCLRSIYTCPCHNPLSHFKFCPFAFSHSSIPRSLHSHYTYECHTPSGYSSTQFAPARAIIIRVTLHPRGVEIVTHTLSLSGPQLFQ